VAVKGWKETTPMDAGELARRCEQDGAPTGVNLEETLKIARAVKIPIIASGVIVGPALYAGGFTFQPALSVSVT
jgi:phosphoribosylformimino-5-aminoimidazole carboxamide ribonucleotide (ProFAR) isomerase